MCFKHESVSQSVTMFIAAIVVSFALGIHENGIQCSTIRYRIEGLNDVKNSTYTTGNLVFSKIFENPISKNGSKIFPTNKNVNGISISDKKDEPAKVAKRRPKFFGSSLAFLAGTSAGKLANVAPVSLYFTLPGYFAGFYNPQQFIPYPYPVLQYPAATAAAFVNKDPENLANKIPIPASSPLTAPSPEPAVPERISHLRDDKVPLPNDATAISPDRDDQTTETRTSSDEAQPNREPVATEVDSKRILPSDEDDDTVEDVDSPPVGEETELRLFGFGDKTTTSTSTTSTTSTPPTTTAAPNVTVSTTQPVENTTAFEIPFHGYYGGFSQDVGHITLTTEDPQERYLKDYTEDIFPLPFERPAIFNPYQNVETYSNPFVNSFSTAERFPEFLNTVESDRHLYDSENRRNLNGFRPILK